MENQNILTLSIDLTNRTQTTALAGFFLALSGDQIAITSEIKETSVVSSKNKVEKPIAKEKKVVVSETPMQIDAKNMETAAEVKNEKPENVEVESEPEVESDPETVSNIKVEDVRALLQKKVSNHRFEIKKKLTDFKANNVTALDSKHYPEFMDFLNALD